MNLRKTRLATALVAVLMSPASQFAWAQDSGSTQESGIATGALSPTQLDAVTVTGSRLAGGTAAEAAQPVQVIAAETFEDLGATEMGEVMSLIPALRSSPPRITATGTAPALNLRGMGSERSLVLVNGRRHVAGIPGSAAVDIDSIPSALVDRVEVLTGGASAVYGSDAVTGVVNYILKENYIGTEATFQTGISEEGDGERVFGSFLHGRNFGPEDRGNVTMSVQGSYSNDISYGDRDFTADNNVYGRVNNPALRFQHGDGVADAWVGQTILLGGGAARYASTPQALLDRARNAATYTYSNNRTYSITSQTALIGWAPTGGSPVNSTRFNTLSDINGDGIHDCYNLKSVGCWVIDPATNEVVVYEDGVIASGSVNIGGNGMPLSHNHTLLVPEQKSVNFNLTANYEVSELFKPYVEAKYVRNRTIASYNSYYDDYLALPLDNAYIPAPLRAIIDAELAADPTLADTAVLTVARDHHDLWGSREHERSTFRTVLGSRGDFSNGWSYDVSVNYGRTRQISDVPTRLDDRFFSAVDAVVDPATGNIVCRISLDPTAMPNVSSTTPGYPNRLSAINTFSPGDCVPLNYFGWNVNSAEALGFQNYRARQETSIEQKVASAVLIGDTADWFSLPGGPIGFVLGAEYREEKSTYTPDAYQRAGYVFQGRSTQVTEGKFDVSEAFMEVSLPLFSGKPLAETLTLNGAFRWSDYSTVGSTETWKVDAVWAPIADLRFRAGYAETIRAPNINELYAPRNTASFSVGPSDPCDLNNLGAGSSYREANCRASLGITGTYGFTNPLTAGVLGESGGNPDLMAEASTSRTYGVVFNPRFLPNFWSTVDYWNIRIDDAIASVSALQILENCYDAPSLDNPFCGLFTRNMDPNSIYYRGVNYILQTSTNFAGLEASGIDFSVNYRFDLPGIGGSSSPGALSLSLSGTYLETRDDFPYPDDPDEANPEKGELDYPQWTFNTNVNWKLNEAFSVGLLSTYYGTQSLPEIETVTQYEAPYVSATWTHNASLRWKFNDGVNFTFGVNNLTNETPYITQLSSPVSAVGRYYFARVNVTF